MSSASHELIDAALRHLKGLKAHGVRFVQVSPEALASLDSALASRAPGRMSSAASPAGVPARSLRPPTQSVPPVPPQVRVDAPIVAKPAITETNASSFEAPATLPVPDLPPSLPTAEKIEALRELRERALACLKCANLAAARTNVVFGVGNVDAELMFVGEAPGADEDRQGEPFVGAAGQLLTKIIQTMGVSRDTVYIANILKCRPDTPGQASGNRKPTPEEMKTCIPYLHSQIDIIRPRVLVALGGTAIEGLLGKTEGIMRLRGNWRTYRGIPLMPTFHPAYLLRNMALSEKRKVWEDMLKVMEKLGMPISEKQRGFFLPR